MSNELKRVGLVFTQEGAVDFKKTLQEINIEMNKNYNQFKLTQAQWDSSTKSTEKLRAEQEYLKNAYEIQADKVSTLKMQLSDLENAENKNTTAIKKKQNELTNAEIKLENYNKRIKEIESQLNNTGKKIEEFGTKVQNVGNKIEGVGKKLSVFSTATAGALVASAKSAINFESAFTGVEKTVDGTAEQMEELKKGIRDMAKEIPSSTTEISAVAEAAGQLGIKTEDVLSFTRVMIDLGNSTNLSADEAASALAKFANITKMSAKDYDKLGSTIVALGNNFATTEADIVSMSTRLAATGELAGLSQPQILSLATAMSSVGIEAEAGGSAMSKLLKKIQVATETGNKDLKKFAKVAGMTSNEFKQAFEKDAVKALTKFIKGLNNTERNGKSAISVLDDMGITEVRLSNTILSLANASDLMTEAVELGSEAWEDNTALTNEANKRYETLESKLKTAINKLQDMAITVGNKLMPSLEKTIDGFGKWIEKFENLSDEQVDMIVKLGLIVAAAGPVVTIIGKLTSTIGGAITGIGTFAQAIGVMNGTITSASTAVNGLSSILTAVANPVSLVAVAVVAGTAALVAYETASIKAKTSLNGLKEEVEKQRDAWKKMGETRRELLDNSMTEIEVSEKLYEELKQITDENGKVKEGYETRAKVILNTLNKALGTEYELNGNIISSYKELQENINKTISIKKAEAVLNAYQEEYSTAIKEQSKATETLIELKKQLADASKKIQNSTGRERQEAITSYSQISKKIKEETELISSYGKTIEDYENLQVASVNNSTKEINKAIENIGKSYDTAKDKTKESIEEQINIQGEYVKYLKQSLEDARQTNDKYQESILSSQLESNQKQLKELANSLGQQTATIETLSVEQINAWKTLANSNMDAYSEGLSQLPKETQSEIVKATGVITLNTTAENAGMKLSERITSLYQQGLKIDEVTSKEINNTATEISKDKTVEEETSKLARRAEHVLKKNDSKVWGSDLVKGMGTGIKNESNGIWFKGILSGFANKIASYIHFSKPDVGPLREYEKWMPDMVKGLGNSLEKASPELIGKVKDMSEEMSEELQNTNGYVQTTNSRNVDYQRLEVDYNKMGQAIAKALTNCKFTLDEDGFARIVKDELYKVV